MVAVKAGGAVAMTVVSELGGCDVETRLFVEFGCMELLVMIVWAIEDAAVVIVDNEDAGREWEGNVTTLWGRNCMVEVGMVGETSSPGVVVEEEDSWSARVV